jgi:tRNA threonylcarbamoyladenosine biosynthesis protein TsaB
MNLKAASLPSKHLGKTLGLAIHGTTGTLEIAIAPISASPSFVEPLPEFAKPGNFTYRSWDLGREVSSQIHLCLLELLTEFEATHNLKFGWSDLAWIAVARGIGSFTSTRVSMVLVRSLAQQLELPVFALDCETISSYATSGNLPLGISLFELAQELAQEKLLSGEFPHWSEALPSYGGDFGQGNI